ncbi:hypothetical protein BCR41DRAFT_390781 [Lobosporangium transversale]|uniref:F-box domain-containing protein n=1 Tax=Lobosporangium transversale TaxID=64571 RepID=A0A1Y2G5P6_9FUNG|nr:hypothetical protein BCR41DRAFT_390781 [Lobosporangium transversale]ORY95971.1 hypothetical protein BCR41DRAFT_390781 [Lobosporangium transversale]|eukprot:XP_021875412.1 hypothetical protein BCR41DRAFT_390781 [Lobosporangium transversale]
MNSFKLNPLEIPEIISLVGDFLPRSDLPNCLRISKTFYSALVNLVWNALEKHKEAIEELVVSSDLECYESLRGCDRLKHIFIYDITTDEVDPFFQLCKRLRYLDMQYTTLTRLPLNFLDNDEDTFIFPNLSILSFVRVKIPHCLGMWTARCPGLRSLKVLNKDNPIDDFYRTAFLNHPYKPKAISDLCLPDVRIEDEDMAAILRQLTQLRQLKVPGYNFGVLSLRELLADEQEILENGHVLRIKRVQRLCDIIEVLKLRLGDMKADGGGQAILANCPRLRILCGVRIKVSEVVGGSEWVSTGLTKLQVDFGVGVDKESAEGLEKQRIVFKQLGRLTRLRKLNLTYSRHGKPQTFDLRLRTNLDELANLRSLRFLSLNGEAQW